MHEPIDHAKRAALIAMGAEIDECKHRISQVNKCHVDPDDPDNPRLKNVDEYIALCYRVQQLTAEYGCILRNHLPPGVIRLHFDSAPPKEES